MHVTKHSWPWAAMALLLVLAAHAGPSGAQAPEATETRLAAFARLVGGEWHLGDQYQVFEWGLDGKSIRVRAYSTAGDEPVLVSDGMIFLHVGEDVVRSYVVAKGMGIDLFEYRMSFEGNRMTADLTTFGQMSGEFEEVWEFADADHYEWTLFQKAGEEKVKLMGGTFERR